MFFLSVLFGLWIGRKTLIVGNQKNYFGFIGTRMQKRVHQISRNVALQMLIIQLWVNAICQMMIFYNFISILIAARKPAHSIVKCPIWIRAN
jgi:hypothetical protein